MKRKYYLDYLRVLSILLLFPVHTFMIWNDFGQKFYVWGGESKLLSSLIVLVNPWFMPILFAIAGMCARYSLEKRSTKEFVRERINKLFIPLVSGIILLVPFQTLFARKYFYNYEGGVIENTIYFFTHITDFSGYDGCFTPGQLWFILFLFIISLISLLVGKIVPYEKVSKRISKAPVWMIIGLFIIVWLMYYIGNFGSFSIGKNLALYLLGYYVLSNEDIMSKLEHFGNILLAVFCISSIALTVCYFQYSYYGDIVVNFIGWIGICAMLPFGKKYFNREMKLIIYFNKASFPIYILHQSILVALSYYVLSFVNGIFIQVLIILFGSFILTIAAYELLKRIPYLRNIFAIK